MKARKARKTTNYMGADVTIYQSIDPAITSTFVGYEYTQYTSEITVMTTEDEIVPALSDGQKRHNFHSGNTVLCHKRRTVSRYRFIYGQDAVFEVKDTIKLQGGKIGHVGTVIQGVFKTGDKVDLKINEAQRRASAKTTARPTCFRKRLKRCWAAMCSRLVLMWMHTVCVSTLHTLHQ